VKASILLLTNSCDLILFSYRLGAAATKRSGSLLFLNRLFLRLQEFLEAEWLSPRKVNKMTNELQGSTQASMVTRCEVLGCDRILRDGGAICSKHRVRKEDGVVLYIRPVFQTLAPEEFLLGEVAEVDLDRGVISVEFRGPVKRTIRLDSRFFRKITESSKIENTVAPTDWLLEANLSF